MFGVEMQKKSFRSAKVEHFTESVIREMTRQAMLHGAVNLAQGFPGFPGSGRDQAGGAGGDRTRTSISTPSPGARRICGRPSPGRCRSGRGLRSIPRREITVCCGSTEAMISTLLAVCNRGRRSRDLRALLRELRAGFDSLRAKPRFVKLRPPTRRGGGVDISMSANCGRPSTITPRRSS